jgi:hypothetical protein
MTGRKGSRVPRTNDVAMIGLVFALFAGIGLPVHRTAHAADLPLRPPVRSSAAVDIQRAGFASSGARETIGAISARPTSAAAHPANAATTRALSARARFHEARAVMDRALLLREADPRANVAVLDVAMNDVSNDLLAIERMPHGRSTDTVREAMKLADEWHQAGLKIIRPPSQGLLEVPLPMMVRAKAEAVSAVLDQVAEQASTYAPPQRAVGSPRRRASAGSPATAKAPSPAMAYFH